MSDRLSGGVVVARPCGLIAFLRRLCDARVDRGVPEPQLAIRRESEIDERIGTRSDMRRRSCRAAESARPRAALSPAGRCTARSARRRESCSSVKRRHAGPPRSSRRRARAGTRRWARAASTSPDRTRRPRTVRSPAVLLVLHASATAAMKKPSVTSRFLHQIAVRSRNSQPSSYSRGPLAPVPNVDPTSCR